MRIRRGFLVGIASMACSGLAGCAGFWDEVTSREFSVKELYSPPDPITVLRTSKDGDARAKALRRLDEPRKKGNAAQQDEVVAMLSTAAVSEPQPLCRMAAIHTLGRFEDPRAVPALQAAYESANQLSPDLAFMVRCQAVTALGQTKQPDAARFLADVAKKPVKNELHDVQSGQNRDVRLAAVRALGNFPGSQSASDAVQMLAANDKDVAVRDRARESYAALTGHEPTTLPPAPPTPVQTVGHQEPAKK